MKILRRRGRAIKRGARSVSDLMQFAQIPMSVVQRMEGNVVQKSMRGEDDSPGEMRLNGSNQLAVQIAKVTLSRRLEMLTDRDQPFPFHTATFDMPLEILPVAFQPINDSWSLHARQAVLPKDENA